MRASLLRRNATREQVHLDDHQRLRYEPKRQLIERCERAQEESRADDQDERDGDLGNDERSAHGEASVAGHGSTCALESLTRRDALHRDHRRHPGADGTQAGERRCKHEHPPVEREVQRDGTLPRGQLLNEESAAPPGEHQPERRTGHRHKEAFNKEEPGEPPA
jgi:hypothetical protein